MAQFITALIAAIKAFFVAPPSTPVEVIPTPDLLGDMCAAIQSFEGWHVGSRSYRNHNPGNVRYSPVGYLPIYEPVKRDKDNFAVFKDNETGMRYLRNLIKSKAQKHPDWTLFIFFAGDLQIDGTRVGGFAPAADSNDPIKYASVVAKAMRVNLFTFTLGKLL